jgi:hypothetical protein
MNKSLVVDAIFTHISQNFTNRVIVIKFNIMLNKI